MNKFAKIADGLAGWLTFEQRCGRYSLFSESYFACAVGQLLQYRYPGRVLAEVKHPVLSEVKEGPGKKPRIDFAIASDNEGKYDLVVEIKWVSKSRTLLRDIIRDVIRLDLILPSYANEAILILAGNVKQIRKLFQEPALAPITHLTKTYQPPSLEGDNRNALYFFHALTPSRRKLYLQALQNFHNIKISRGIQMQRSGSSLLKTTNDQYLVFIWKIKPTGMKFSPDEYEVDSEKFITTEAGRSRTPV